jgi:hypothetical protein
MPNFYLYLQGCRQQLDYFDRFQLEGIYLSYNSRSGLAGRAIDSGFLTELKRSSVQMSESSMVESLKAIKKDKRFPVNQIGDKIKLVKRKKKRLIIAYTTSNEVKIPNGKKDNHLFRKGKGTKMTKAESEPILQKMKKIPIIRNSTGNIAPKLKKPSISKLDKFVTTPNLINPFMMGEWRINAF